jgi:hypothetical protein
MYESKLISLWWHIRRKLHLILAVLVIACCFDSCAPTKCVLCDFDNTTVYQVKFKADAKTKIGKEKILTNYYPVTIQRSKKKSELYVIDCEKKVSGQTKEWKDPYLLKGKELEDFIKQNLVIIDKSTVDTIIDTGDSDFAPTVNIGKPDSIKLCNRFRQGLKFELKGMVGLRDLKKDGAPIPGYGSELDKKILGFGGGGTNLVVGVETALMPRIARLGFRNSLNLGLMTGFWPVDSGMFIPIAIHPRITFNEFTSPLWGQCNAFNVFGDIGVAYDASGKVKFLNDKNLPYSWFYDIGAGIDLWRSRNMDLSFDIGYRRTNLALPISEKYKECIDNNGKTVEVTGFPIRSIGQLFFRFGLTF